MHQNFSAHYRTSDEDIKALWDDCVFVFDANVLLNAYRYSPKRREQLFELLRKFQSRIWIPYQVASEYFSNRLDVISQQQTAYDGLDRALDERLKSFEGLRSTNSKHTYAEDIKPFIARIEKAIMRAQQEVKRLRKSHPDFFDHDAVLDDLTALFENRVGEPYQVERLVQVHEEAKGRFKDNVPPGNADAHKGGVEQYGDVVVWYQVIDFAASSKKGIIFVTDDKKSDWWLVHSGRTIGPRPELIKEIGDKAGVAFHMYTSLRFISYAEEFLGIKGEQAFIDEVRRVSEQNQAQVSLQATLDEATAYHIVSDDELGRLERDADSRNNSSRSSVSSSRRHLPDVLNPLSGLDTRAFITQLEAERTAFRDAIANFRTDLMLPVASDLSNVLNPLAGLDTRAFITQLEADRTAFHDAMANFTTDLISSSGLDTRAFIIQLEAERTAFRDAIANMTSGVMRPVAPDEDAPRDPLDRDKEGEGEPSAPA